MVHTQYTNPGTPTLLIISTHLAFPEVKRTPEESRVILRTPPPKTKQKTKQNKTKQKKSLFRWRGKKRANPKFLDCVTKNMNFIFYTYHIFCSGLFFHFCHVSCIRCGTSVFMVESQALGSQHNSHRSGIHKLLDGARHNICSTGICNSGWILSYRSMSSSKREAYHIDAQNFVAIFDVSTENTRGCYTGLWKEKKNNQPK